MAEGVRLRLRVAPSSRRSEIVGRHGDGWKVRVTAAPEGGKANEAVLGLLAGTLAVPRSRLTLVAGETARDKVVEIVGLNPAEAERRLARKGS
jgi:uncharacterized protein (TIGR00251 family)